MNASGRALLVAATCLLTARVALAMDIRQFEAMVEKDQHDYISDLVWGAAILLEQDCKPEVAAQVRTLFIHDPSRSERENWDPTEGTTSLGKKLIAAGKVAADHPEQAPGIRVDDLLRAMLRDKGITLPDRFAAIESAFKPKAPPPVQKPQDDAGFGGITRSANGDLIGDSVIRLLQSAFDVRYTGERAEGKSMRGVCRNATTAAPALPAGVESVAGYQPSWIGRTMTVRGTVARFVQKKVNGEPYVYLYFKERPDSTVVACSRDDYWLLGVLGADDFQSVVGKTLEFNGQVVNQPCAENGASLWIWQRSNARLVGGATR